MPSRFRHRAARFSIRGFLHTAGILFAAAVCVVHPLPAAGESLSTNHVSSIDDESTIFYANDGDTLFTSGIEGPACDAAGNLYAVCYGSQEGIGKVTPEGDASLFVKLPTGCYGNGIRFDSNRNMIVADYKNHNILKVDMATSVIDTVAHNSNMHQPNDIAIDANDVIYASDPNWTKKYWDTGGQLWRITASGTITRVASGLGTTNGIEVSPDGNTLYVNESKQHDILAFDISAAGTLINKRIFYEFADVDSTDLDGMRCDTAGNLYVTRRSPVPLGTGSVVVFSSAGEIIHTVSLLGQSPTNITFGGTDGKTCYVTMADDGSIETFRTDTPGVSWQRFQDDAVAEQLVRPRPFTFAGAAPNPFNPSTVISYTLHRDAVVELSVYNVTGQRVATIASGAEKAGTHKVTWNAKNLASGVYFARLRAEGVSESRKIMLVK